MYLMHNFYIFVTALFLSLLMVPAIRKWALDTGAIDYPGDRRVHVRPVPSVGGVAIFIPFLFSVLVYFDMNREVRGILAGSLLIFFTGLIDDLYTLSPKQKLAGQFAGCLVAVLVGHLYLTNLGDIFGGGPLVLPVLAGGAFALFALVGVVNAVNLIDGLDGLAGGLSVISLLAFFWLGFKDLNYSALALAAGLSGALLGFLKYNAYPAKIFMGDTGSQVVGFVLGAIAIILTQDPHGTVKAVVPLMILSVPISDTLVVMLNRIRKGHHPLAPDRTHLHHNILKLGLGHALTVWLIYALSLFWTLTALVFRNSEDYYLFGGLLLGTLAIHLLLRTLMKNENNYQNVFKQLSGGSQELQLHSFSTQFDRSVSFLMVVCLVLYVLTSVLVGEGFSSQGLPALGAVGVIVSLILMYSDKNQAILSYPLMLAPVLLINYQVERWGDEVVWHSISIAQMTNAIFVFLALLLAVKFLLLKSPDTILDFTLELIIFAMGLTLAIVPSDIDLTYHLSGLISKGIVIFLSLRLLYLKKSKKLLLASALLNLTMLIIIFK